MQTAPRNALKTPFCTIAPRRPQLALSRPGTIHHYHHARSVRPRLLSNMSARDRSTFRRRKCIKPQPDDDNDCASLAWLLSFRLDEIVNVKVPDDEPVVEPEPPAVRKPPYTYPELIERALRENGELTVSAIYQWISDRFPYYKANDERWKNSVRHNLSINPHFRKGARAPHGAGHLWSLAANAIDLLPLRNQLRLEEGELQEAHIIEFPKLKKRTRIPQDASDHIWSFATNAIGLPLRNHLHLKDGGTIHEAHIIGCPKVIVLDEAAIAAASIIPDQDLFSASTMFLNPVSTEQVVRECGLITVD